ncbi:hypothetical protein P154DRAFT_49468 [Amniculicola lignicola CBS 123094]|uniref:AB hydrolase-1 domain-containing protein n=1 Tax=Amniculicola lignicola CBS 123094 TaxID=1392246 RepID=A0A6A5VWQ5_9PLEO|nr:hypothetical protein P154DRAFT_49468 [Amniculicola lignicola CBS 123094]
MIGTSVPEYLFIRTSIFALRAITPLSVFYVAFSIADPPVSIAGRALLSWCVVETSFYVFHFFRKRSLQAPAAHPVPLDREEREALFAQCVRYVPNPEYYLNKWFLGAKSWEIGRENVKEFFAWAMLGRGDKEARALSDDEKSELEGYADGTARMLGRTLEPGRGEAKALRLTTDEVKMLHRPFIWYLTVGLVDTLTSAYLAYSGFRLHRTSYREFLTIFPFRLCTLFTRHVSPAPNLSYWYRPHTSKTRLPILFVHGISIGLYSYAQFLAELAKDEPLSAEDGEVGIIALELMPISFRLTKGAMLDKDSMCRQINTILEAHGWDKVVLVSHSYGSVVTTHLLKTPETKSKIGPIVMVDPVTFLLHLPDVAYNFTARQPRHANEHQLYYFASTDMMVAHTLARHFFWSENILWKEDIRGHDVTVSLGGRDLIVDTETVGKYLAGIDLKAEDSTWKDANYVDHGLRLLWWPTCDHAQVFERAEGRKKLRDVVRGYAESQVTEDEALA